MSGARLLSQNTEVVIETDALGNKRFKTHVNFEGDKGSSNLVAHFGEEDASLCLVVSIECGHDARKLSKEGCEGSSTLLKVIQLPFGCSFEVWRLKIVLDGSDEGGIVIKVVRYIQLNLEIESILCGSLEEGPCIGDHDRFTGKLGGIDGKLGT